ncbi:MAG: hypothetical protein ABGX47_12340 [Martelella sp.]|uniref:hypothetical protein n=1 Tax=Martelella sp. TaxID=1969699 RepID=UPI003242F728
MAQARRKTTPTESVGTRGYLAWSAQTRHLRGVVWGNLNQIWYVVDEVTEPEDFEILRLAAHRPPLTREDCTALRRFAMPAVILGGILLLLMVIRALATFETALATASGV